MSWVNILKRVKIGACWKLLSIPRNDKGNPNWAALPEGRYFIEWYLGGKRRITQLEVVTSGRLAGQHGRVALVPPECCVRSLGIRTYAPMPPGPPRSVV